jgi:hypothetical protein
MVWGQMLVSLRNTDQAHEHARLEVHLVKISSPEEFTWFEPTVKLHLQM